MDLEMTFNKLLNDAMCRKGRIQGIPDSNKIAEFITNWMEANSSNDIHNVSDLLKRYIGQVIASEGETFIPMDQIHPRSEEPRFTREELDYLMRLADEFRGR